MPFHRLSKLLIVCSIVLFLFVTLVANRPLQAQAPVAPADHISGDLLALAAPEMAADGLTAAPAVDSTAAADWLLVDGDRVAVRIVAEDVEDLIPLLERRQFDVLSSMPQLHFVEGYMPLSEITALTELVPAGLAGVLPVYRPLTNSGSVTTEADIVQEAARVRAMPEGYDGSGIMIGVLSDSYDKYTFDAIDAADDVASGDLPNGVLVLDDSAGGSDEGRAMMQLAYDLAPGASFAFATSATGQGSFADNIRDLATAGADVIVDNQVYPDEPFFQDGPIGLAINEVVSDSNVLYFSAAGNLSNRAYESTSFATVTETITGIGEVAVYDFDASPMVTDTHQRIGIPGNASMSLSLQWDDPFFTSGGVDTNLDIYLLNDSGTVVAFSTDNNITNHTPMEILNYTNPGTTFEEYDLVIVLAGGTAPTRIKYINYGSELFVYEFDTDSPTVIPHAAAEGAQAVGAVSYYDHAYPRTFTAHGPSTFLFDPDGNPLGAADVRQTPNFVSIDGTNTTFYGADNDSDGLPNFQGTSAAAAHAAGIAALARQAYPAATPDEIYAMMANGAVDIVEGGATSGFDNVTGAGLVNAYDVIYPLQKQPVNLVFSDDFENGVLSPVWETVTRKSSRLQLTSEHGPVDSYHVTMDVFGGFGLGLNELILHLNLAGGSNVSLSFDQRNYKDEAGDPMPATFTGSHNSDGVALSVDGGSTWYRIISFDDNNSETLYQTYTFNLSDIAATNGITLGDDVRLKFQQYDAFEIDGELAQAGRAFDTIQVTSDTPAGIPEIEVFEGETALTNGAATVDFGTVDVGAPLSKTFTISNTGFSTLTLSSLTVPTGFAIASDFGTAEVAAGGATSFTISLTAEVVNPYSGTVSFATNDSDENPFAFDVTGVVTSSVVPEIVVSLDSRELADGQLVDFGGTISGTQLVKSFTISNTGTTTLTLANLGVPAGFAIASDFGVTEVATGTATTFAISLTAEAVGTYSGTLTFDTNDSDETVFDLALLGSVTAGPEPEIIVEDAGLNVASGDLVDFGAVITGTPLTKTFTVLNSGTTTLTLANLSVPAGFAIASDFGLTDVPTGTATTFVISLTGTVPDLYSGTLTFETNDSDETLFEIELSGEILPEPEPEISLSAAGEAIVDGGSYDFGTTTIGTAVTQTFTISNSGTASLTLANLSVPAGFTVTHSLSDTVGVGMTTTFGMALEATAVGPISGTVSFENNDTDENPFEFEVSGEVLGLPEIVVTAAGLNIPNGGAFDFGPTLVGQPLTQRFTISNSGTATLTLANLSVPAGFSIVTPFSETVGVGLTTTMQIQLDGTAVDTYSGTVRFETNDGDENPYSFVITGTVTAPEILVSVDGIELLNGSGFVDFGSTVISQTVTKTLVISNSGTADLLVSDFTAPAGFTITAPLSLTVPVSGGVGITMTLEAAAAGVYSGTVSFNSTDEDETPYTFDIEGTVTISPEAEIQLLDGIVNIFDGVSTVDFGTTPFGTPVTKVLTIKNLGLVDLTLGSLSVPSGYTAVFSDTIIPPGGSTPFTVTLTAAEAGTFEATIAFDSNDSNESRFTFDVSGVVEEEPNPEIEVYDGIRLLIDDVSTVDFGVAQPGVPVSKSFTVVNTGVGDLLLSNLDVIGSGFSIASDFITTTVPPGQFTTFAVQLDGTAAQEYMGVVTFNNNDETENPFRFIIKGKVEVLVFLPIVAR